MSIPPEPVLSIRRPIPLPALSPCSSTSNDSFFTVLSTSCDSDLNPPSGRLTGSSIAFPSSPQEHNTHGSALDVLAGPGVEKTPTASNKSEQKPLPTLPPLKLFIEIEPPVASDVAPGIPPIPPLHPRPILRSMSARQPPIVQRQRNVSMPSRMPKPFAGDYKTLPHPRPLVEGIAGKELPRSENSDFKKISQHHQVPSSSQRSCSWRAVSSDALASLAWTGHFSTPTSPVSQPHSGHATTFLLPFPLASFEPSSTTLGSGLTVFPISAADSQPSERFDTHTQPCTIAKAITDPLITDELLLEEFENVRMAERVWEWSGPPSPVSPAGTSPTEARSLGLLRRTTLRSEPGSHAGGNEWINSNLPRKLKLPMRSLSDPTSAQTWQTARRALLVCREIVRTERNYLTSLRRLCTNETRTSPPAGMLERVMPLMAAGEVLLNRFEHNPSALGVAEAFTSSEAALKAPFIEWCSVVGGFFTPPEFGRDPLINVSSLREPIRRRLSVWTKMKILSPAASGIKPAKGTEGDSLAAGRPSVRELAILPTQRIMRYVLLYKDLFRHTPQASPSHIWVEQAVLAASRLAQACDEAQGNMAFIR